MKQIPKLWFYLIGLIAVVGGTSYLMTQAWTRPAEPGAMHPAERKRAVGPIMVHLPDAEKSGLNSRDEPDLKPLDRVNLDSGSQGAGEAERAEWVLVGQVLPNPTGQESQARLRVDGVDSDQQPCWFEKELALDEGGSFQVGITQFVDRLHPENANPIRVRLDMGWTLVAQGSFYLSDAETENRSGVAVQVANIILAAERVASIHGKVLDPDLKPLSDCLVGLFSTTEPGDVPQLISQTRASHDGSFHVQTSALGRVYLVVAHQPWRPLTMSLLSQPGTAKDVGTLLATAGAEITGSVVPAAEGARLLVESLSAFPERPYLGHFLAWNGATFEYGSQATSIDEDGSFEVHGLAPGPYHRCVLLGGSATCSMVGAPGRSTELIDAPSRGVVLRFSAPRFRVAVQSQASPVSGAMVELFRGEELVASCRTGGDGQTEILVLAGEHLTLEVSAPKMRTERWSVKMPDMAGSVLETVDLVPILGRGSLRLIPDSVPSKWPGPVRVELFSDEDADDLSVPELSLAFEEETEPILLKEIPVGKYSMRVVCRGTGGEMYPPVVSGVEIRNSKEVEQRVLLSLGGRVSVRVLGHDGLTRDVACTVRNSEGEELPVVFDSRDAITGAIRRDPHRPHPGAGMSVDLVPVLYALPPGSYKLEIEREDEGVQEVSFEVVAGEQTRVTVNLN